MKDPFVGVFSEKFLAYCMDRQGCYPEPTTINSSEDLATFLNNSVEKTYELRITDENDCCVMHVVDQTLIFPLPETGSPNNKWDPQKKRFVTVGS